MRRIARGPVWGHGMNGEPTVIVVEPGDGAAQDGADVAVALATGAALATAEAAAADAAEARADAESAALVATSAGVAAGVAEDRMARVEADLAACMQMIDALSALVIQALDEAGAAEESAGVAVEVAAVERTGEATPAQDAPAETEGATDGDGGAGEETREAPRKRHEARRGFARGRG